jgi:hypothetical protein
MGTILWLMLTLLGWASAFSMLQEAVSAVILEVTTAVVAYNFLLQRRRAAALKNLTTVIGGRVVRDRRPGGGQFLHRRKAVVLTWWHRRRVGSSARKAEAKRAAVPTHRLKGFRSPEAVLARKGQHQRLMAHKLRMRTAFGRPVSGDPFGPGRQLPRPVIRTEAPAKVRAASTFLNEGNMAVRIARHRLLGKGLPPALASAEVFVSATATAPKAVATKKAQPFQAARFYRAPWETRAATLPAEERAKYVAYHWAANSHLERQLRVHNRMPQRSPSLPC